MFIYITRIRYRNNIIMAAYRPAILNFFFVTYNSRLG